MSDLNEKPDNAPGAPEATVHRQPGVLLVDDSHKNRRMAREVLGRAGIPVITAVDGFDALAKVVIYRPSLVFADSILPRLDGYQTCALIRNNVDYEDINVVLLCAEEHPFDKARAKMVGINARLTKPLTEEALLRGVDQFGGPSMQTDTPD